MAAIECDNPSLKGVLPGDYARPGLDKQRLGQIINLVNDIVMACAPCNYGRADRALEEEGLLDPRSYPAVVSPWDGLDRFRQDVDSVPIAEQANGAGASHA